MVDESRWPFDECWSCERPLADTFWPECDDCMIAKGPAHHWCCDDENGDVPNGAMPFQLSTCIYNLAYWGRYDEVFHRRALTRATDGGKL